MNVIADQKTHQTRSRLVESINTALSSMTGKVLAAPMLQSGNILVTAHGLDTENFMEQEDDWKKVTAG